MYKIIINVNDLSIYYRKANLLVDAVAMKKAIEKKEAEIKSMEMAKKGGAD